MSLGHSRLLVHCLPSDVRVFGTVGLGVVGKEKGNGEVGDTGAKGVKVVGLGVVSFIVGLVVR